jgi:pimeloyl-ACP methyl ester carboxylesterase
MTDAERFLAETENRAEIYEIPHDHGRSVWRVWGEGPSLVLLHGGAGSWMHWIRNIGPLSRHFRVFVPDIPGFGDSDPLPEYSVLALAPVMAQAVEALPVGDSYCLAGFSFGAWVGGHMLAYHQKRVKRLILVGAGGLGRVNRRMELMKSWRPLRSREERSEVHRYNLGVLMLAKPESVDDLAVAVQAHSAEATVFRHRQVGDEPLLKDCIARWPVRLTAIWGENDVVVKGYLEERRQAAFALDPDADFHIVPDAGHWIQFEAPDTVNALLSDACGQ